jgi:hypothetical protein
VKADNKSKPAGPALQDYLATKYGASESEDADA